jgi:hypothetical protein
MSFVTAIRDYVETLNTISESLGQNLTLPSFISETLFYILKTFQSGLLYILSFQWIRDFTLLPIVLPQFSSALFKETFFLETPSKVFFEFLEIPDLHQNKFLLGFFNSFFLSLPISVVHVLSIRRLLIQGIPAGVYSIGGYVIGQILFLTFTVFGVRQILIPWLTLEPLNYVIGVILIFRIIYSMTQENLKELTGWFNPKHQSFFLTSFVLAWCEQSSIFQYLGNLTVSSNVTILESFSSNSSISSFFTHFLYVIGIACGSILFTAFWGFIFLQIKNWCIFYTPLFTSSFIQLINKTSFVLALSLSLTSIPFYGFDYLVTGPLGFISQDSVFKNTVFDQNRVKDFVGGLLASPESSYKYVDIDIAPFDRGEYLTTPDVAQPLSFEDLNYRIDFDWTTRNSKVSGITDSRSGFFTLSKVFKKQKKSQIESQYQSPLNENSNLNQLISENREGFDPNEIDSQSESFKRFRKFYDVDTEETENLQLPYKELYTTSFPTDYLRTQTIIEKEIEQKIKDKYDSNPVYKSLLAVDIDLFLKRQPKNYQLNADQEIDLYTKRKMLESYYDSLRQYSYLPYSETFDSFFDGAKSFSNKVYNQQFKGTLRSVRRLFTLRLNSDSESGGSVKTLLKFDQPMYEFSDKQTFSSYHEELGNQAKKPEDFLKKSSDPDKFVSRNDFLNKPLYAGWDEHLRKFVITNKFIPRTFAGYKVNIEPETRRQFTQDSLKQGQKIKFTAWPLSEQKLQTPKGESTIPYVTLFDSLDEKAKNTFGEDFVTLPANLEKWSLVQRQNEKGQEQSLIEESLVPKRGGFIWPGNSKLKFPSLANS